MRCDAKSNSSIPSKNSDPAPVPWLPFCKHSSTWARNPPASAAQLIFFGAAPCAPESRWINLAYTSLPVPLSPTSNTAISVRAMLTIAASSACIAAPCPHTYPASTGISFISTVIGVPWSSPCPANVHPGTAVSPEKSCNWGTTRTSSRRTGHSKLKVF